MTTCPVSCPWKDNGCYADGGPLLIHWRKVSSGERGVPWGEFLGQVANLPEKQVWRHNQAGDLVAKDRRSKGGRLMINKPKLDALVTANIGKRGFTYTHYPVEGISLTATRNRRLIKETNEKGFAINLSGDNIAHADKLMKLEIAPVTTVVPSSENRKNFKSPDGHTIVVCPAAWLEDKSCANCKLCAIINRKAIIAFPAHGARKRQVDAYISKE